MRQLASRGTTACLILLVGGASACAGPDESQVFQFEGTGIVQGEVFLDLARTGSRSAGDPALRSVPIRLVRVGTRDTVLSFVTDTAGTFGILDVPPGRFTVIPDPAFMGDTLQVSNLFPLGAEVRPGQTTNLSIALSFPLRSIPEILSGPQGARVFARGIALNRTGNLPDAAVHLRSDGRALRVTGVSAGAFAPGDTVLLLGRTLNVRGQMTLSDGSGRRIREGLGDPQPVPLSTVQAAVAAGGPAGADLVLVSDAEVLEVRTSFGELVVTVSDGSGPLILRFPSSFLSELRVTELEVGEVIDVRGLLLRAPQGSGWELRPRVASDIVGLEPEF